jgi:hypothetical protein
MQDRTVEIDSIHYRRLFPWTHLFRAFGIAVDIRKLLLAALALVLLPAGDYVFRLLPFAPDGDDRRGAVLFPWEATHDTAALTGFSTLANLPAHGQTFFQPLTALTTPAAVLLRADRSWSDVAYAWTLLLWAFGVWAIIGGAITRMAAVEFARDEKVGIGSALRFSIERFLSYFTAPLLYIGFIGVLWALCVLGGWAGRIPFVGEVLVGLLWVIPLVFGFLMAVLLIGLVAGWPLMLAAISTEGSDAFDGFGRSFSYIYDRPWRYAWYGLVAVAYGTVVTLFVWGLTVLFVYLAGLGIASGMGADRTAELFRSNPALLGGPNLIAGRDQGVLVIGPPLVGVWLNLVALLIVGFVYSYLLSAWTIIYFLLRRIDDATDLDQVYLPDEEQHDDLLPLIEQPTSEPKILSDRTDKSNTATDGNDATGQSVGNRAGIEG